MTERYYYEASSLEFGCSVVDCEAEIDAGGYDVMDSQDNQRIAWCEQFHLAVRVCEALNG